MLNGLTLILCCQLAGELLSSALKGPIPGPVVGMVILFAILLIRGSVPDSLQSTQQALLGNFSLLFVPAGVGVMLHFRLLSSDWLPIAVALVLSTVLTIAITAILMSALSKRQPDTNQPRPEKRND